MTRRIPEIDAAKGIGIALVVLGHMVARDLKPQGNDWWIVWHDHLYSFHMAFFFFLSGYVFFLQRPDTWPARFAKSAGKLVPAYLLFGAIVYLAKALAVRYLHVDRPVGDPLAELTQSLIYPLNGFAQFLWFIYTLLMIYGLMVLLRPWVTKHYGLALAVAFVLHLLSVTGYVTDVLALHQLCRYTLFFLIGAACHRHPDAWRALFDKWFYPLAAVFVIVLVFMPEQWLPTLAGLLCIPVLVGLAFRLQRFDHWRRLLVFLGTSTLTIYLMSALAMGLVRAIVVRFWGWDGWHFFVVMPLLLGAGLFLPILVQRTIFARWAWLDRITR